jgi:hypothetical protein
MRSRRHELGYRSGVEAFAGRERGAMRISRTLIAAVAVSMPLAGLSAVGCSSGSKPAPTTSKSSTSTVAGGTSTSASTAAPSSSYTGLLIQANEINAPETFTATPPINDPNGQPGVTTTFSNQDRTHVIVDTIQVLPDPAAAVSALESAKAARDGYVHGAPEPIAIGTSGTTISGPSPDGAKGVTVLLFTEGKAFAELEFDGPADVLAPPEFVTDVGQKQDAAIKKGLAG